MTATILDRIVAAKRRELARRREAQPQAVLEARLVRRVPRDFAGAIGGEGLKLIAEVKKASPSRGLLCPDFDPVKLAGDYARGGAAAISVLTEEEHFQGRLEYLAAIREAVGLPLLRKDFVFDPYQIYESAAAGADALLLIVAILERAQLKDLLALGRGLGLDCLVETHDEREIETALAAGANIIGINNRDLHTFNTDIATTRRLRPLVPAGHTVVSESGIRDRDDMEKMKAWGVNAVLVGEALVTAGGIPERMEALLR